MRACARRRSERSEGPGQVLRPSHGAPDSGRLCAHGCAGVLGVYSYPRAEGELGKTQHTVITSNRRWREEEFLIPRHLTEGVKRLEIKIEHVPDPRELFPGHPFPAESAWSESRYWAYCYKMPQVPW